MFVGVRECITLYRAACQDDARESKRRVRELEEELAKASGRAQELQEKLAAEQTRRAHDARERSRTDDIEQVLRARVQELEAALVRLQDAARERGQGQAGAGGSEQMRLEMGRERQGREVEVGRERRESELEAEVERLRGEKEGAAAEGARARAELVGEREERERERAEREQLQLALQKSVREKLALEEAAAFLMSPSHQKGRMQAAQACPPFFRPHSHSRFPSSHTKDACRRTWRKPGSGRTRCWQGKGSG
jgi:hypothetical protein